MNGLLSITMFITFAGVIFSIVVPGASGAFLPIAIVGGLFAVPLFIYCWEMKTHEDETLVEKTDPNFKPYGIIPLGYQIPSGMCGVSVKQPSGEVKTMVYTPVELRQLGRTHYLDRQHGYYWPKG